MGLFNSQIFLKYSDQGKNFAGDKHSNLFNKHLIDDFVIFLTNCHNICLIMGCFNSHIN